MAPPPRSPAGLSRRHFIAVPELHLADVFSLRALWAAAARAARGKRTRPAIARFRLDLERQLCALRDDLLAGRWSPSRPQLLAIRDPKPRTISVLPFRDRVVHQALGAVLAPRLERWLLRGYLRYMDDFLLFHDDRLALAAVARAVEEALWTLRLRLHPWDVHPTRAGVGFVGYRVLADHVRIRRTGVARAECRLAGLVADVERGDRDPADLWESLRATFGHWSHADSWRLKERLLRRLGLLHDGGGPWDPQEP